MINNNLLEILRCPACVREKDGLLKVYQRILADLPGLWAQISDRG